LVGEELNEEPESETNLLDRALQQERSPEDAVRSLKDCTRVIERHRSAKLPAAADRLRARRLLQPALRAWSLGCRLASLQRRWRTQRLFGAWRALAVDDSARLGGVLAELRDLQERHERLQHAVADGCATRTKGAIAAALSLAGVSAMLAWQFRVIMELQTEIRREAKNRRQDNEEVVGRMRVEFFKADDAVEQKLSKEMGDLRSEAEERDRRVLREVAHLDAEQQRIRQAVARCTANFAKISGRRMEVFADSLFGKWFAQMPKLSKL